MLTTGEVTQDCHSVKQASQSEEVLLDKELEIALEVVNNLFAFIEQNHNVFNQTLCKLQAELGCDVIVRLNHPVQHKQFEMGLLLVVAEV